MSSSSGKAAALIIVATLLASHHASADGIVRRAAADGAWATFYGAEKWNDGTERTIEFTIKSVGRTTVDGQPARWIGTANIDGGRIRRRREPLGA